MFYWYIAATGAIFGVALGATNVGISLIIPFIALGCSIIVSHHNILIGALLDYCSKEIKEFIENTGVENAAPQFDSSKSFKRYIHSTLLLRAWGHAIILIIPCAASLGLNWEHAIHSSFPLGQAWWFALVCSGVCGYTVYCVHRLRSRSSDNDV